MTRSFLYSELLVPMQPGLIIHHHKLELFVERLDCCIQIQGHRDGSKFIDCLSVLYFLYHGCL